MNKYSFILQAVSALSRKNAPSLPFLVTGLTGRFRAERSFVENLKPKTQSEILARLLAVWKAAASEAWRLAGWR
jgi:hypothetical protein